MLHCSWILSYLLKEIKSNLCLLQEGNKESTHVERYKNGVVGWLVSWYQGYYCCRQLRFSLYSGAVITKVLAVVLSLLLSSSLWLCGVSYALCLLPSLLRCSGCLLCSASLSSNLPDHSFACPKFWASAASFIQYIFAMHLGIACLGLCILG